MDYKSKRDIHDRRAFNTISRDINFHSSSTIFHSPSIVERLSLEKAIVNKPKP